MSRRINERIEKNIINEPKREKKLIKDKSIPITSYNYSYIKDQLYQNYEQKAAFSTIISRAKKEGFYKPRQKERRSHDREVLTDYIGELIQHDSSHHKFSPYADKEWYLITNLDDYSRLLSITGSCRRKPPGTTFLRSKRLPYPRYSFRLLSGFSLYVSLCPGKRERLEKTLPFNWWGWHSVENGD